MSQFGRTAGFRPAVSNRTEQRTNRTATIGGRWGRSTVSATMHGLRNGRFDSPEATEQ